jgi:hypothetical protein
VVLVLGGVEVEVEVGVAAVVVMAFFAVFSVVAATAAAALAATEALVIRVIASNITTPLLQICCCDFR